MNTAINVGPSKEALAEARASVLAILKSGADQDTIRVALKAYRDVTKVGNISISGCTFGPTK
jgi:hypothetical protein